MRPLIRRLRIAAVAAIAATAGPGLLAQAQVLKEGHLLVTDVLSNQVIQIDPKNGSQTPLETGFANPRDVVVDPDAWLGINEEGFVYVADRSDSGVAFLVRIDTANSDDLLFSFNPVAVAQRGIELLPDDGRFAAGRRQIVVAEPFEDQISRFDPATGVPFGFAINGLGEELMRFPTGIRSASCGIFVADSSSLRARIHKIDPDTGLPEVVASNPVLPCLLNTMPTDCEDEEQSNFSVIRGLAIDEDDGCKLLVVDSGFRRIAQVDQAAYELHCQGGPLDGDPCTQGPDCDFVEGGEPISGTCSSENVVNFFGTGTTFSFPTGIAFGSRLCEQDRTEACTQDSDCAEIGGECKQGDLFVTDLDNAAVYRMVREDDGSDVKFGEPMEITSGGHLIGPWGINVVPTRNLLTPAPLLVADTGVDPGDGAIYCVDRTNSADATLKAIATGLMNPARVARGLGEEIYVVDGDRLIGLDPDAGVCAAGTPGSTVAFEASGFDTLTGVAVEFDGDILVSDSGSRAIFRIDGSDPTSEPEIVSACGEIVSPQDLTVDRNGRILVADNLVDEAGTNIAGRVISINPATGEQTVLATDPAVTELSGVAVDTNGDPLYTGGLGSPATQQTVDRIVSAFIRPTSGGQFFEELAGIVVDANRDLLVSNNREDSTAQLIHIDVVSGIQTPISLASSFVNVGGLALDVPAEPAAFDSDGDTVPDKVDDCSQEDCVIGNDDFIVLRNQFGNRLAAPEFVDFDGDGFIGNLDFNILRNKFGQPLGPTGYKSLDLCTPPL